VVVALFSSPPMLVSGAAISDAEQRDLLPAHTFFCWSAVYMPQVLLGPGGGGVVRPAR
jgi:hypothetical protein